MDIWKKLSALCSTVLIARIYSSIFLNGESQSIGMCLRLNVFTKIKLAVFNTLNNVTAATT